MSKIKIGDLFELEKGSLQSSKCTAGEYDFITASKEWKTHNEYSHDTEALIFAAMASGSLGRTHYVNGKFITSDLCYILTPKDSEKYPINLKFYHFVFNSLRDEIVKNTKSGTSKESINQTNLKKYEIPYFDIAQQNIWIERLLQTKSIKEGLEEEIQTQQELLKKLRQSILQEAIEGKLTKEWREQNLDIESASVLLEKIKQEKEQLILEKKIKKQKPLPPINEDEIPFDIPDSWEWINVGEIIQLTDNLNIQAKLDANSIINYVDIDAINNITYSIDNIKIKPVKELSSRARRILKKDYIVYSTVRPYLNNITIIKNEVENFIGSTGFIVFKPIKVLNKYFFFFLLSSYIEKYYLTLIGDFNSPSITNDEFFTTFFPLPPLKEQKEIVKKIENLFTVCDALEEEIESSKKSSSQLMQAVLKEAFEK